MSITELMTHHAQPGKVIWIGIREKRKLPLQTVERVHAVAGKGLEGDHYHAENGNRQVTLIQKEHLEAVGSFLGRTEIDPSLVRRNIVVSGINLYALKNKDFRLGEAVLRYTGECHPCSRMEENLGEGGYNAMRGHGGITARIIEGGELRINDVLVPIPE